MKHNSSTFLCFAFLFCPSDHANAHNHFVGEIASNEHSDQDIARETKFLLNIFFTQFAVVAGEFGHEFQWERCSPR